MNEKNVMDALVQMKRTGNLLNELWDLTQQLGESIDRNDQVSIQMLIAMREEPLGKIQAADQALRDQLEALPDREDAHQLAAMLSRCCATRWAPTSGGSSRSPSWIGYSTSGWPGGIRHTIKAQK